MPTLPLMLLLALGARTAHALCMNQTEADEAMRADHKKIYKCPTENGCCTPDYDAMEQIRDDEKGTESPIFITVIDEEKPVKGAPPPPASPPAIPFEWRRGPPGNPQSPESDGLVVCGARNPCPKAGKDGTSEQMCCAGKDKDGMPSTEGRECGEMCAMDKLEIAYEGPDGAACGAHTACSELEDVCCGEPLSTGFNVAASVKESTRAPTEGKCGKRCADAQVAIEYEGAACGKHTPCSLRGGKMQTCCAWDGGAGELKAEGVCGDMCTQGGEEIEYEGPDGAACNKYTQCTAPTDKCCGTVLAGIAAARDASDGTCGSVCAEGQVEIPYDGKLPDTYDDPSPPPPPSSPPAIPFVWRRDPIDGSPPAPPPVPPDIAISPRVVQAGVSTTLSVHGLGVADGAWLVFLPAGDTTCAGAAAAHVPAGDRLFGGNVTVHLARAAQYKLCVSSMVDEPWLDDQFVVSSGVTLSVVAFLASDGISVSPAAVRAGAATEVSIRGLYDKGHAASAREAVWAVFLPAGDATCAGAAGAYVLPVGGRCVGGECKVKVALGDPGLHKLCFSRLRRPSLDTDFVFASGAVLVAKPKEVTKDPTVGVAVLHGWTGNQLACLPDDDDRTTTALYGGVQKTIAVQCCSVQKDIARAGLLFEVTQDKDKCKRSVGTSKDPCVGGSPPKPHSYVDAVKRCRELSTTEMPLTLCDSACGGTGCGYNAYPVFTSKPCALAVKG